MKKFLAGLHIISDIICVGIIICLALKMQNGHVSQSEFIPYFISFMISGAISGVTRFPLRSIEEDVCDRSRKHYFNMVEHQQMQDQQARYMTAQAVEQARLAATGIEFGGYNPDPNLNPGMSSSMQDFGCNNNFGMF